MPAVPCPALPGLPAWLERIYFNSIFGCCVFPVSRRTRDDDMIEFNRVLKKFCLFDIVERCSAGMAVPKLLHSDAERFVIHAFNICH